MSLRKNIFQGWVNFESYIHFEAGADTRICFQYDCWCGDDNLEPCKIARNVEATMADIWMCQMHTQWSPFIWTVQDGGLESMDSFLEDLYAGKVHQGLEYRII